MAEFQDKNLSCRDCGKEFTFTAGEQEFYEKKGFENEPVRCPQCRASRKRNKTPQGQKGFKPLVDVVCESCGKATKVPFKPTQGKPVYCRECFDKTSGKTNVAS